jgi:hypothetical protein
LAPGLREARRQPLSDPAMPAVLNLAARLFDVTVVALIFVAFS